MRRAHPPAVPGKSVTIVGAGGNIGSQLIPHVGRMREIARVILIDPDVYEPGNLNCQDIGVQDLGKPKVEVQAQRLLRIRSRLRVSSIPAPIESVPLGKLRSDLILSCLDSRRARQDVNRAALRLGIPWIDAGIEAEGSLARVSKFIPASGQACMECLWDQRHYAVLEQTHSCLGVSVRSTPTQAPTSLGALAASLQALECSKFLTGGIRAAAFGSQIVIDAAHHKQYVTSFSRNPGCRLADHSVWRIDRFRGHPGKVSLGEALGLGAPGNGAGGARRDLRVEGSPFVTKLFCPRCGRARSLLRHVASMTPAILRCRACNTRMGGTGFAMLDGLEASRLPERVLRRSLRSIGLRVGEVFSVGEPGGEKHYEITLSNRAAAGALREGSRG